MAVISHIIWAISSPPRGEGCALLANSTPRQPPVPHPCPSSPHLKYSISRLPGPAHAFPPLVSHQPSSSTPSSQNTAGQKTTFLFSGHFGSLNLLTVQSGRHLCRCNERSRNTWPWLKGYLKLRAMPPPLGSKARQGNGASLRLTGQRLHGLYTAVHSLYTGSVPWSDSQPPWRCSCVTGQDAPSWKCWRLALIKPKPHTSMKKSHMIFPFPCPPPKKKKKLIFGFAMKGATAFRAAAPLTLVNTWYDEMGEKGRQNEEETFPFFFLLRCTVSLYSQ